jgi:hypothetical protein
MFEQFLQQRLLRAKYVHGFPSQQQQADFIDTSATGWGRLEGMAVGFFSPWALDAPSLGCPSVNVARRITLRAALGAPCLFAVSPPVELRVPRRWATVPHRQCPNRGTASVQVSALASLSNVGRLVRRGHGHDDDGQLVPSRNFRKNKKVPATSSQSQKPYGTRTDRVYLRAVAYVARATPRAVPDNGKGPDVLVETSVGPISCHC